LKILSKKNLTELFFSFTMNKIKGAGNKDYPGSPELKEE
jgi:hypothetical protein